MVKQLLRILLVVPAIAATLSGCSLYVKSDVNTALISSVHCNSFAWAGAFRGNSPLRNTVASPLNEDRLRSAIAAHLKGGTVQTAPGNADCLVGYGIGSSLVVDPGFPAGPYGYGFGPGPWGWGGPWGPWGWDGPYVYRQGLIGIDLFDGKTREALWHASVDQNLTGATGAAAEQKIDAAVAALFTHFPS